MDSDIKFVFNVSAIKVAFFKNGTVTDKNKRRIFPRKSVSKTIRTLSRAIKCYQEERQKKKYHKYKIHLYSLSRPLGGS